MANQKLFLTKKTHHELVGNSMSTSYCFDPKRNCLTVFWKDEKVFQGIAHLGDVFVVNCYGGKPKVNKLKMPKRKSDILMWLFSFNKEARAHSTDEFNELLAEARHHNDFWNYREYTVNEELYKFVLCSRPDCGGVLHIAAYVSDEISKQDIIQMFNDYQKIRFLYYPISFIRNVLKESFGFSEDELDTIQTLRNIAEE